MLIQGLICTNNPFSVAIVAGSCPSTHINPTSPGGRVQYVQCMPQYLSEFPPKLNGPNVGRPYSEWCLQDLFLENSSSRMPLHWWPSPPPIHPWKCIPPRQLTTMMAQVKVKPGWGQLWSYYMQKTNSADAFHQESISFSITQAMAQYAWHCCSGILMKPGTGWMNTQFNRITFNVILQCDFQDAQYTRIWHYKV